MARRRAASPSPVLFVAMLCGQACLLVLSPMLPAVAAEFGLTPAVAGQLRSASGVAAGAAALALGSLGGQFRLRDLLACGLALLAGGSLVSAAAPTFAVLVAAQIPIGTGLALVLGGAVAAADEWAPPGGRARVLSWTLLGPPAAWVVGMPIAGALTEVSWRAAWLAVPFAASVVAAAWVAAWPRGEARSAVAHPWRRALRRPGVASWAVAELFAYGAWSGTLIYIGALFIESYGVGPRAVGLLLAGAAVVYMPGNFLARRWVDTAAQPLLAALALLSAVGVAVLGGVRLGVGGSFGVFALLALLAGARTIAGSAFGLDAAPAEKVVVTSLRAAALQFGYLIGAAAGGGAIALGGYRALGVVFAVLYVLAAAPHAVATARTLMRSPAPSTRG